MIRWVQDNKKKLKEEELCSKSSWIVHFPKDFTYRQPARCTIEDSSGLHAFQCISEADRYLDQFEGYCQTRFEYDLKVYSSTGELVTFRFK